MISEAALLSIDPPAGAWNTSSSHLICLPQDVRNVKNEVGATMESLRRDVAACQALSPAERNAWNDFYTSWRKFFCRNETGTCTEPDYAIWSLCDQITDAEEWRSRMYQWQDRLAAVCKLSAPTGPPAPMEHPEVDWIKWAAIGAAALTALYIVKQTGLPRIFPKGRR
jgi:hypothetical protein